MLRFFLAMVSAAAAMAQEPADGILVRRCSGCHSAQMASGGLDLTSRETALRGGKQGPALVPGNAAGSLLLKRIEARQMPPGKTLEAAEIDAIRKWIDGGAPWKPKPVWWSLLPLDTAKAITRPAPAGFIDRYIGKKLRENGLRPSASADRRTLIRRVTFGLTGMPPTPAEIGAFVSDSSPDAYERLVDRLLASPRYGEHWARHWLDIVRFSESEGFERDQLRDYAWRYRDYVIDSLNRDKSYLTFAREQIAGDVMEPVTVDGIVATGFLVAGPTDAVGLTSTVAREREMVREDQMEEMVGTVSQTFLGMTANCARCHDHRFDPIPQRDYYRFKAALAGVWQPFVDPLSSDLMADGRLMLEPAAVAEHHRKLDALNAKLEEFESKIGAAHLGVRERILKHALVVRPVAVWNFDSDVRDQIGQLHGKPNEKAVIAGGRLQVAPGATEAASVSTPVLRADITEKTLEAWLVARKPEKGAPVLIIRNRTGFRGAASDGILFGGGEKKQWSNQSTANFRTEDVGGGAEPAKEGERVHMAIVYSKDSTIQIFRNGAPYGKAYRPDTQSGALQRYDAGDAIVTLTASPSFDLDEARLYNVALTPEQVAASFAAGAPSLAAAESLAAMTPPQQAEVRQWENGAAAVRDAIKALPKPDKVFAAAPRDPGVQHVLLRGDVDRKGEAVSAGGLSCVRGVNSDFSLRPDASDAERRRALAEWIAQPANPLFSRVMVNRLWHYHFGAGIVENPNDFGFNGGQPSHPELLDALANEFIRGGWSLKKLHKTILMSSTYQQASRSNPEASAKDASNRLLWRYSPRRLEAETIRDSMLAVSGRLNLKMGGASFRAFEAKRLGGSFVQYQPRDSEDAEWQRRTIYRMSITTGGDPMLDSLDCPVPSVKTPKRASTTTALQALSLMNNAQAVRLSRAFAARLESEADTTDARIARAFHLALGRAPGEKELSSSRALIEAQGLEALTWGLFNTSEFAYVE